jgi:integrase
VSRDPLFGLRGDGFTAWARGKTALDARSGVTGWTLHDIRRSVATRMADLGIGPHIIEQILNHQSGHKAGPAGIYNRSSYANETRAALALWEDHIRTLVEGGERKILPLPSAAP